MEWSYPKGEVTSATIMKAGGMGVPKLFRAQMILPCTSDARPEAAGFEVRWFFWGAGGCLFFFFQSVLSFLTMTLFLPIGIGIFNFCCCILNANKLLVIFMKQEMPLNFTRDLDLGLAMMSL